MKKYYLLLLATIFFTMCKEEDELGNNNSCPNCPVVESISPSEGASGDTVLITGKNYDRFVEEGSVTINGIEAIVIESSPTQIRVEVPDDASSGKVVVCAKNPNLSRDNLLCSEENISFTISEVVIGSIIEGEITGSDILGSCVTTDGKMVLVILNEYMEDGFSDITIGTITNSNNIEDLGSYLIKGLITSVTKTLDGGFIISGNDFVIEGLGPDLSDGGNGYLNKFSANGNIEWQGEYSNNSNNWDGPVFLNHVIQTSSGEYIAVGKYGFGYPDWEANSFVLRVNENGGIKPEWVDAQNNKGKLIADPNSNSNASRLLRVAETEEGIFTAVGVAEYRDYPRYIEFNENGSLSKNILIENFSNQRILNDVIITSDGNTIAIGQKQVGNQFDIILMTFDANKNIDEEFIFGGTKNDLGDKIIEKDGEFFVFGKTNSFGLDSEFYEGYLLRLDSDFNEIDLIPFSDYENIGSFNLVDISLTADSLFFITANIPGGSYYATIDENGEVQ